MITNLHYSKGTTVAPQFAPIDSLAQVIAKLPSQFRKNYREIFTVITINAIYVHKSQGTVI